MAHPPPDAHHRMPTDLPLDALEMALWVRGHAGADVTGVIHHCDAGSHYVALRDTSARRRRGAGLDRDRRRLV